MHAIAESVTRKPRLAVVTICVGPAYERLGRICHPTIERYAARIGADFIIVRSVTRSDVPVGYEKMRMRTFLETYERVIFVDSDIIIRSDCPDLFDVVPPGWLGVLNEGDFVDRWPVLAEGSAQFGMEIVDAARWGRRYYNTGVMVFDRAHEALFQWPDVCHDNYFEQTYLNLRINRLVDWSRVKDLGHRFNRMSLFDSVVNEHRTDAYIVHYAGTTSGSGWSDLLSADMSIEDFILADLDRWATLGLLDTPPAGGPRNPVRSSGPL